MAGKSKNDKALTLRRAEYYKGPLPHPSIIEKYEKILPGAADRIIAMAERQAKHRQDLENKITNTSLKNETRGMLFSFILTILLMILGAYLIFTNHEVAGFISLFAPSIFHAANYIYSKYEDSHDKDEE